MRFRADGLSYLLRKLSLITTHPQNVRPSCPLRNMLQISFQTLCPRKSRRSQEGQSRTDIVLMRSIWIIFAKRMLAVFYAFPYFLEGEEDVGESGEAGAEDGRFSRIGRERQW